MWNFSKINWHIRRVRSVENRSVCVTIAQQSSFYSLIASSGINGSVTSTYHYKRNYLQKRAHIDGAYLVRSISKTLRNIRRRYISRAFTLLAPVCSAIPVVVRWLNLLSDRGLFREPKFIHVIGNVALFSAERKASIDLPRPKKVSRRAPWLPLSVYRSSSTFNLSQVSAFIPILHRVTLAASGDV